MLLTFFSAFLGSRFDSDLLISFGSSSSGRAKKTTTVVVVGLKNEDQKVTTLHSDARRCRAIGLRLTPAQARRDDK
jgi:hypothetical protein